MQQQRINTIGVAPRNAAVRRRQNVLQSDVSSLPTATNEHAKMVADCLYKQSSMRSIGDADEVAISHAVSYRNIGLDAQREDSTLGQYLATLQYSTNA